MTSEATPHEFRQFGEIKPKKEYKILWQDDGNFVPDYHVTYRLSDKCNMSCEYCRWYDGENYDFALETIEKLFEFFKHEKFKSVLFYFHGGEPGIHPHVIPVLEKLREQEQSTGIKTVIEFQTNLSYTWRRVENIIKLVDKFSVSYHFIDLCKSKDEILLKNFHTNMENIMSNNYPLERLDVMLENVPEERLQEFYDNVLYFLKYENIKYSEMIHSFCHYENNPTTKQQHLDFYNKHNKTEQGYMIDGEYYNTNALFEKGVDCRGCKCEAGINNIVVNADGNVFHCGVEFTYYRLKCEPVDPITNVLTDPQYRQKMSIKRKIGTICKWDYCGGDFYIPREPV